MRPYHRKLSPEPMRILVRHADAGDSRQWTHPEHAGELSGLGRVQAENLVDHLAGLPILRILTSPALCCRQTVLPLARDLSLPVETWGLLRANSDPALLETFLADEASSNAVLWTHRETLLSLFARFAATGSRLIDGLAGMTAPAVWIVYGRPERPPRVRYLHSAVPAALLDGDGRRIA